MPYKDPEMKREWERSHSRLRVLNRALQRIAHRRIRILSQMQELVAELTNG